MKLIATAIFIFILVFTGCGSDTVTISDPFDSALAEAAVYYVVDGDTFYCSIGSVNGKVRVLDIDTYETSMNDRLRAQAKKAGISADSALALGLAAKSWAISLLQGRNVILKTDPGEDNKDIYGRYLRHVEIDGMRYDSLVFAKGFSVP